MRKFLIGLALVLVILAAGGFLLYKIYFPEMVADAIVSKKELPVYIPKRIKAKIEQHKVPINKGAEDVIKKMHESKITLEQVFETIDDTSDEQLYAMLDELNTTTITDANQVFDIAKKHISTDYDMEALREPFVKNVTVSTIKRSLRYANIYRQELNPELVRAVGKKVLLQKEQEYNKAMGYQ